METKNYLKQFTHVYNRTQESIEEGLMHLKASGASQIDSVKVLMEALELTLTEADVIILNSSAWSDHKNITKNIRDTFIDYLNDENP